MIVGTVRSNRIGLPKRLMNTKLAKGELDYRRKDNMVALKWRDKRDVTMLSTIHDPTEKVTVITRHATTEKPVLVRDYTKYMCGTDRNDQLHAYVPLRRRSLKWWKKLFLHLYTLSLIQAHILHNKVLTQKNKRAWGLYKFLVVLGDALCEDYMQKKSEDPAEATNPEPTAAAQAIDRLVGKHFPRLLPPTEKKTQPRCACKVCLDRARADPDKDRKSRKRTETKHWCNTCKIPLCVDTDCFEVYHTRLDYITQ
ncbi:PiggyBac transposable element-derived protein 4 [Plakobranchus ocellatus]|uniref:PiggyBac transposable element-derived protein 4 n=1 Tax=Plakobranchus ocellatus TaxID=259542 RepID=A0AAV4AJN1_9GAST|nr:PiggyBac transposable element-derived protein 4 [Plakobranchus ocellatus]